MNESIRTLARATALALMLTALAAGATGAVLAASPHEGTAWHLYTDRDQTRIAGVGTRDWGRGEAMLFLLAGGTCRVDTYDADGAIESIAPPSSCLGNACLPCTWSGDSKGKRVTVKFSTTIANELMVGNLTEIAYEEGADPTGLSFTLTKNKCSGVVKSGRLTIVWDVAGKVTVPAEGLKNRSASHQVRVSGTQVQ
jgi:hypothetical protein